MEAPGRLDRRTRGAPPARLSRQPVNWGAVLVGALAGLGVTAVVAVVMFAFGVRPDAHSGGIAFIFIQFVGLFVAGIVAGRFSHPTEFQAGSLAALGLFLVTSVLTMVTGGEPAVATIVFGAVVAFILGAAGGVLAGQIARG